MIFPVVLGRFLFRVALWVMTIDSKIDREGSVQT